MYNTSSAQVRYRHVPRVKVDGQKSAKRTVREEKIVSSTTSIFENEEAADMKTAYEPQVNIENTSIVSTSDEILVADIKTTSVVKHKGALKNNKKSGRDLFTQKVKENSKLMDVKDVKKTNMEKWLICMIILYAFGLIFMIVAFIFLAYSYFYLTLSYVFIIIGAVCLLAASIMPLLGLTGHWYK